MNLVIRNVDPETRGLLYRAQGEGNFPNLPKTLDYIMREYYKVK